MTIGVIELRPKACYDDKQWVPAAVGNITRPGYLRYAVESDAKGKEVTIKSINFLKGGHASNADRVRDQLRYNNYAPLLHRHARAIGTTSKDGGWQSGHIDADDTRLVEFKTIKDLNAYLATHKIAPAAPNASPVNQVVLPQGTQTVQELYQELAKVMAKDPKAASAPVIKCVGSIDTDTLTDAQMGVQTLNIGKALLTNAVDGVAKRFEHQANAELARVYKELNPGAKVPTVALTATIVPPGETVVVKK